MDDQEHIDDPDAFAMENVVETVLSRHTANRKRRSDEIGIKFETVAEGGRVKDWVFDVPFSFVPALDIQLTVRKNRWTRRDESVWTRGDPPVLAFKVGDILYQPIERQKPSAEPLPWSEQIMSLKASVQVVAQAGDEGPLTVDYVLYTEGVIAERNRVTMTQQELVELLEAGRLPVPAC